MLTYEIIAKYLMPVQNTFSQQPNIIMKNCDFTHFNKIFDDTFYRYGVIFNNDKYISLKSSILYCIDPNYHNLTSDIINNIINTNDIKIIVNNLNINILVFDFKNNKISSEYKGDYFNPWKPTIYLANYNDWWEPIITKDCKIFSFTSIKSSILKNNILMQDISRYNTTEQININDNFNEIIEMEGFNNTQIDDSIEEDSNTADTFITLEKPKRSKLDKMKKDELIQLCNTLNKIISINKPTKKDLIDLICKE
jgi:hypothetical protein